MKVLPSINLFKNIKEKPYKLLSKEIGVDIASRERLVEPIGIHDAKVADVVVIGNVANPEQQKIITTFRDSANKIVERVFEFVGYKDKPEVHRVYNEMKGIYKFDNGSNCITGRLIRTYENLDASGKYKAWKKVASEKQYVSRGCANNEPNHVTIAKVTTDERFLSDTKTEHHSLTEYCVPKAHDGMKNTPKHIEFYTTKNEKGIPEITTITASGDVYIPQNDEFLAVRIYDAEDMREPFVRMLQKKKNMSGLDIRVEPDYVSSSAGAFNHTSGTIKFKEDELVKDEVIDTAFHELQHTWQYALLSLFDKIDTPFARMCKEKAKINGEVSEALLKKVEAYHNAHVNYVPAKKDYNLYRQNLLEKEAFEAGENGLKEYIESGKDLSLQFDFMPMYEL